MEVAVATLLFMGVSVAMGQVDTPLVPGQRTTSDVRVQNTGDVVDQVELDVVGEVAEWAHVEPHTINLLPGEEKSAQLVFQTPRSFRVTEGNAAYALRAMSREDTEGSVVQEGVVAIGAFSQVVGEMLPRTSTGKRSARHEVALDNLGNHPELVSIDASDPDLKLDFRIEPVNLEIPAGSASFVKIRVKPRRTFLRGANQTIPFEVTATPEEGEAVVLPGAMLQTSILPPWFFKAVAALVVAAVALVILWFTLFKPTIESAAREVAEDETEQLAEAIVAASDKSDQANQAAAQAAEDAAEAEQEAKSADKAATRAQKSAERVEEVGGTSATTLNAANATDYRVTTDVPPEGGFRNEVREVPPRTTVWISDLVLQNPAGDTGRLRIQRGEEILLVFGLENFRDLDYHFIQPAKFVTDAPIVVSVDCKNPTDNCTPSVYLSGQSIEKKQKKQQPTAQPAGQD